MASYLLLWKLRFPYLIGFLSFSLILFLSTIPSQSQDTLSADLNGDNIIDEKDLYILLGSSGSQHGEEKYNMFYDLNSDNEVNHLDVMEFVQQWHTTPAPRVPTTSEELNDLILLPESEEEAWELHCAIEDSTDPLCTNGIRIYGGEVIDLTGTLVMPVNIALATDDFSISLMVTQEGDQEIPQLDLSASLFEEYDAPYSIPDQTIVFSDPLLISPSNVVSGATSGGDTSMTFAIEFDGFGKTRLRQEMELPITYETQWIDCSEKGDWSHSCLIMTYHVEFMGSTYSFYNISHFDENGLLITDSSFALNGGEFMEIAFETVPPEDAQPGDLLAYFENPSPAQYDHFGWEIGVLGNHLIAGVPFHDEGINKDLGEAYLLDGNTQELLTTFHKQTPYDPLFDVGFGTAVAGIDHFVLVADIREVTTGGAVYIYDADPKSATLGEPIREPITNPKSGGLFGEDIVIHENVIAIGAQAGILGGTYSSGFVALYQYDPEQRTFDRNPQIIPNPLDVGISLGTILAITDELLLLGAPSYSQNDISTTGIAFVFGSNPSSPHYGELLATLHNPNATPEIYESFGVEIAIVDSLLAVGASGHDPGDGQAPGTIYLFDGDLESPTFGELVRTIRNPQTDGYNYSFPSALTAIGGYLAAGSSSAVAIYLFDPSTGNIELTIDDPSDKGRDFGSSLAVTAEGNLLVADDDSNEGTNGNGIVYLFKGPDGKKK